MDSDNLVAQLLDGRITVEQLVRTYDNDVIAGVVVRLKAAADEHYGINANRSLEIADILVGLGIRCGKPSYTALGLMTRGDAQKFLGQTEAAWESLAEAGTLFQSIGDEVGWARTRIGRLLIAVDLRRVQEALADGEHARAIFVRHQVREKHVVLDLNTAIVYGLLGQRQRALELYHSAIAMAEGLGEQGRAQLGQLYNNVGVIYETLGHFHDAHTYYERAYAVFLARRQISAAAIVKQNRACVAIDQGQHRRALQLLHEALALSRAEHLPLDTAHAQRAMIECYLALNRYAEARTLAQEAVAAYRGFSLSLREAQTLLLLATAEAELGDYAAAQRSLDAAGAIFVSLDADVLLAATRLERGQIALRQGDLATAQEAALACTAAFAASGQRVEYATAQLLHGRTLLAQGDRAAALAAGQATLAIARQGNLPPLRYTAHLLLGQIAEANQAQLRAERHYRAAAATATRVQQGLTITLRPGFLEDKGEALRALIGLYLRTGQIERAFAALERAKSQTLFSYLINREQLRWSTYDQSSQVLIEQLNQLRGEHQWFYRLAHEPARHTQPGAPAFDPQQAAAELALRERQIRAITEQLYLRSSGSGAGPAISVPAWHQLQQHIDADDLLIEFYNDGAALWAFTLDQQGLALHPLAATVRELGYKLQQFQLNQSAALTTGPHGTLASGLSRAARIILQELYTALLAPLAAQLHRRRRLVIVPFGALHYLPFHLLHTGSAYLIEAHEVVILPAAGLVARPGPRRPAGGQVLAHSWEGRLLNTLREAQRVGQLIGARVYQEQETQRALFAQAPRQILHIAAHGEHRLDQPDRSYIQLDDGQLYADDLLQCDLSYELVTLSACETGRANVAAGDELIGLGRGFLYAGAGALVASLWHVPDNGDTVMTLMEQLYQRLLAGATKTSALREAQCHILADTPQLHPAFWGMFQLVGDPRPLSTVSG